MEQVLPLHLRSLPKLVIMNPMANFTMLVPYMVTNFFFVSTNSTWQTASYKMDNSNSFGYGLGNSKDVAAKDPEDYVVGYDLPNRQSSTAIHLNVALWLKKRRSHWLLSMLYLLATATGKFFEVMIGTRPEPIWQLLSKVEYSTHWNPFSQLYW